MNEILNELLDMVLELVYPAHANCMGCASPLGADVDWLCTDCLSALTPVSSMQGYRCPVCGRLTDQEERCPACAQWPEDGVSRALFAYPYRAPVDRMIRRMKYQGAHQMIEWMGAALYQTVHEECLPRPDLVIAVPMHPTRERARGFNPPALLAASLCERTKWTRSASLIRTRNTAQQARLSASERMQNLDGAFRALESFSGQRILLIDDVLTTGSTANHCASVLRAAGAADVALLALAGADRRDE